MNGNQKIGSIVENDRYESNEIMGEEEICSFAMAITSGSIFPMVLNTVIELGIFEIIKRAGPGVFVSPAQIAAQMPTKNPDAASMLDRMLRLLASYSVLRCTTRTGSETNGLIERVYGLTSVCQFLTKNEDNVSLGALALVVHSKVFMESWYHLKDAIINGNFAFKEGHGMAPFEYLERDARFSKIFDNGMSNHSMIVMKKILEKYKGFAGVSTLVDVGGGNGATIDMIISRYPSIRGINFDLPHVIANAPTYNGVEHVAGDMFLSVPQADAIFMKWICHDWSDEECMKLLKNCYEALPDGGGKLIICDFILPAKPDSSHATRTVYQYDVLMMASTSGGKERSELELEALTKAAGFKGFTVACSAFEIKVVDVFKII